MHTPQDDLSPLFAASKEGYTEIVDILLQKGVDPNLFNTVRIYTMYHPKANPVYTSLISHCRTLC